MGGKARTSTKITEIKREDSFSHRQEASGTKSINPQVAHILFLQRAIGNQSIQRLINSGASLTKPGDINPKDGYKYESKVMAETLVIGRISGSILRATGYPIVQRYSPPTGKTDLNAIIPMVDFIRYVEAVEKGYPSDTPTDIVSRIRVQYYSGIAFGQLIPGAHTTDIVPTPRGAIFVPRTLSSGVIGEEAYKHLTAHADENAPGDNPSPYVQLAGGERLDVGHLFLGLDALIHPATSIPYTDYGVPNIDPASWAADLGIASVWMTQHEESKSPPDDAPKKLSTPDLDEYYKMSAPEEDLLGDVDSFGIHEQWVAKPGQTLSQVLRAYYLGQPGQPATAGKRWQTFCAKNGFAYTKSGNSITWAPHLKPALVTRVDTFNNLFAAGKWGAAWATTFGSPKKRTWPHTPEVVDKFLAFVKTRLEAEFASGTP